jgi:quercetin dioxygenase-like cupin family protein
MKILSQSLRIGIVVLASAASAATAQTADAHKIVSPQDIKWGPAPASLPPGAELAVLYGDPSKEGEFAMRLKGAKGYHIAPHTHPKPEIVTVISGTVRLEWERLRITARLSSCPSPASSHFLRAWRTTSSLTKIPSCKLTPPGRGASTTSTRRMIRGSHNNALALYCARGLSTWSGTANAVHSAPGRSDRLHKFCLGRLATVRLWHFSDLARSE